MVKHLFLSLLKQEKDVIYSKNLTKRTDFISNFVMVNNAPAWINFDEGRVIMDGTNVLFTETHLKDHLGNARVTFTFRGNALEVRQVSSYYPFGMSIKGLSSQNFIAESYSPNEYLYNGKMFQDELELEWYDYGARFYDAAVGRWWSVDPSTEKYSAWSPYNYAFNNPINVIDPNGKDGELIIEDNNLTVKVTMNYSKESLDRYNANLDGDYTQEQFINDFKNYYEAANGNYEIDGEEYNLSFKIDFNVVEKDADMPPADAKDGSTNLTFDTNKEEAGSHFNNLITLGNSPRGSAGAEDTGGSLSHEIIHGLGVTDTKEYTSGKLSSYSTDRSLQSSEVIQMIQPAMQFAKENNIKNGSVLITHSRGSKPRDYPIQLK